MVWTALCVAVASSHARADDYTETEVSGRYSAPPANATVLPLTSPSAAVTLVQSPFTFPYWGGEYDEIYVAAWGYVTVAPEQVPNRCWEWDQFPPGNPPGAIRARVNGTTAACNDEFDFTEQGEVTMHVDGAKPNRTVVFTWANCTLRTGEAGLSFQIHIEEGSGDITLAYKPDTMPSTWPTDPLVFNWSVGVDAPHVDDERWLVPSRMDRGASANQGHPGTDFLFEPVVTTYTGTLAFDKLVSDATGIGNSTTSDVPAGDVLLELRWGPGDTRVGGRTRTNSDGTFSLDALAVPSDGREGVLVAIVDTAICTVSTNSGAAPVEAIVETEIELGVDADLGTITVDGNNERLREALNVATTLQAVHDFATPHIDESIPALEVLLDGAGADLTEYTPAGQNPASLRIGGASSSNPDPWDDGVIAKVYGRHVLECVAAASPTAVDTTFDGETDATNAFAEGFGFYLFAAATGETSAFDGTSTSATTEFDLEDPQATTARGPEVAAWVAANLFDFVDGANEGEDRVDGSAPERPLEIIDDFDTAVDAVAFFERWGHLTPDAGALARLSIHHGIVEDDDAEPNDDVGEPTSVGPAPLRVEERTLNLYDEDWFEFTLPADAPELVVELIRGFEVEPVPSITFELRNSLDSVIHSGTSSLAGETLSFVTGQLMAGAYRLRVKHDSGSVVVPYDLQVSQVLAITGTPLPEWTQFVRYDESLGVVGGLPPLTHSDVDPNLLPDGLRIDADGAVRGAAVERGSFSISFRSTDSGTPQHVATASQTLTINPPVALDFAPFIGFPVGRAFTITRDGHGGTAPFTFEVTTGALPDGLSVAPGSLEISGTATTPGSSPVTLTLTDGPGSTDDAVAGIVVCVDNRGTAKPKAIASLAGGDAACGFWVDALVGGKLSFVAKSADKKNKRTLVPFVIGPDGRSIASETNGKLTSGGGKKPVKAKGLIAPVSGRFFFIVASDSGEETDIVTSTTNQLPKKEKGTVLDAGDGREIPFEIGALEGAVLNVTAKGKGKNGTIARLDRLIAPDGSIVFASSILALKDSKRGFKASIPLDQDGTWTVVLVASGGTGKLTYNAKISQPKGAFSVD